MPRITAADVEMVEDASFKILMDAPALVNKNPTFVIAALTLALAHAAVLTDQTYEDAEAPLRRCRSRAADGRDRRLRFRQATIRRSVMNPYRWAREGRTCRRCLVERTGHHFLDFLCTTCDAVGRIKAHIDHVMEEALGHQIGNLLEDVSEAVAREQVEIQHMLDVLIAARLK